MCDNDAGSRWPPYDLATEPGGFYAVCTICKRRHAHFRQRYNDEMRTGDYLSVCALVKRHCLPGILETDDAELFVRVLRFTIGALRRSQAMDPSLGADALTEYATELLIDAAAHKCERVLRHAASQFVFLPLLDISATDDGGVQVAPLSPATAAASQNEIYTGRARPFSKIEVLLAFQRSQLGEQSLRLLLEHFPIVDMSLLGLAVQSYDCDLRTFRLMLECSALTAEQLAQSVGTYRRTLLYFLPINEKILEFVPYFVSELGIDPTHIDVYGCTALDTVTRFFRSHLSCGRLLDTHNFCAGTPCPHCKSLRARVTNCLRRYLMY